VSGQLLAQRGFGAVGEFHQGLDERIALRLLSAHLAARLGRTGADQRRVGGGGEAGGGGLARETGRGLA